MKEIRTEIKNPNYTVDTIKEALMLASIGIYHECNNGKATTIVIYED